MQAGILKSLFAVTAGLKPGKALRAGEAPTGSTASHPHAGMRHTKCTRHASRYTKQNTRRQSKIYALPVCWEGATALCVQGRWRREPARAKTSQSSCLQRLTVLLPSQVCQAAGKLPHTDQTREKNPRRCHSVNGGVMPVLRGHLWHSEGPPSSDSSQGCSHKAGTCHLCPSDRISVAIYNLLNHFYFQVCLLPQKKPRTPNIYTPAASSCTQILLAPTRSTPHARQSAFLPEELPDFPDGGLERDVSD